MRRDGTPVPISVIQPASFDVQPPTFEHIPLGTTEPLEETA
jgi:hypothetical protein